MGRWVYHELINETLQEILCNKPWYLLPCTCTSTQCTVTKTLFLYWKTSLFSQILFYFFTNCFFPLNFITLAFPCCLAVNTAVEYPWFYLVNSIDSWSKCFRVLCVYFGIQDTLQALMYTCMEHCVSDNETIIYESFHTFENTTINT